MTADAARPLAGQHAFVTGGGTGIGAAIAARLARAGAAVTIAGRRTATLEAAVAALAEAGAGAGAVTRAGASTGAAAGFVTVDVTNEDSVRAGFAAAKAARGVVTIVVNNAGVAQSAPASRTTLALWNEALAVNATGTFLCTREFLAQLPKDASGRIVNVASTAGLKGYPYVSAYCAAKHAVVGYTRALALELARRPVTANAVCPGFTETAILEESVANIVSTTGRAAADARAELAKTNPQGRFVQPAEVAEAVHWLCLPASAAVTGTVIPVAGGEV